MIFAEKILDLAKCTKIENSTSGLWSMRDELPEVLWEKIPKNQANWMVFVQAIRAVDMGHIGEGVENIKRKQRAMHKSRLTSTSSNSAQQQ